MKHNEQTQKPIKKEQYEPLEKVCAPTGANANLIRFVVGLVFLNEGILKFLYPFTQTAGRFAKIGIPFRIFLARLWPRWKPFAARWFFWAC